MGKSRGERRVIFSSSGAIRTTWLGNRRRAKIRGVWRRRRKGARVRERGEPPVTGKQFGEDEEEEEYEDDDVGETAGTEAKGSARVRNAIGGLGFVLLSLFLYLSLSPPYVCLTSLYLAAASYHTNHKTRPLLDFPKANVDRRLSWLGLPCSLTGPLTWVSLIWAQKQLVVTLKPKSSLLKFFRLFIFIYLLLLLLFFYFSFFWRETMSLTYVSLRRQNFHFNW